MNIIELRIPREIPSLGAPDIFPFIDDHFNRYSKPEKMIVNIGMRTDMEI